MAGKFDVFYKKHLLKFKFDAGTSRGILRTKEVYYVLIKERGRECIAGLGEAAPLKGLSIDDRADFEEKVALYCKQAADGIEEDLGYRAIIDNIGQEFPALRFGFEMALMDWMNGRDRIYYNSNFIRGSSSVPINGLIWMSDKRNMLNQIKEKVERGFQCIKLKIGALNFEEECELLAFIRSRFGPEEVMLRVDANGAFTPSEALEKLKRLFQYDLHSIEQPVEAGNLEAMQKLCQQSPVDIALDEALVGVLNAEAKETLLKRVQPQYIVLKPTLLGGFKATDEWIRIAERLNIGWWITSALESNIGLNAIAQYTAQLSYEGYQGLGTGQLFHNNIPSPLEIEQGRLYYRKDTPWNLTLLSE